jgi:hypothetical protein
MGGPPDFHEIDNAFGELCDWIRAQAGGPLRQGSTRPRLDRHWSGHD